MAAIMPPWVSSSHVLNTALHGVMDAASVSFAFN